MTLGGNQKVKDNLVLIIQGDTHVQVSVYDAELLSKAHPKN